MNNFNFVADFRPLFHINLEIFHLSFVKLSINTAYIVHTKYHYFFNYFITHIKN